MGSLRDQGRIGNLPRPRALPEIGSLEWGLLCGPRPLSIGGLPGAGRPPRTRGLGRGSLHRVGRLCRNRDSSRVQGFPFCSDPGNVRGLARNGDPGHVRGLPGTGDRGCVGRLGGSGDPGRIVG